MNYESLKITKKIVKFNYCIGHIRHHMSGYIRASEWSHLDSDDEASEDGTQRLIREEASEFRRIVARGNYLCMERPELAFAFTELCRIARTPR